MARWIIDTMLVHEVLVDIAEVAGQLVVSNNSDGDLEGQCTY